MARLVLMTTAPDDAQDVLPALGLLSHQLSVLPADIAAFAGHGGQVDALVLDGRRDLVTARALSRMLEAADVGIPVLLVLTEGGMAAVSPDWHVSDVVLDSSGPAEIEARLRLAMARSGQSEPQHAAVPEGPSDLEIDENAYTAHVRDRILDLTFKEFELLKYLAQHPGRVFSRAQLLQDVWGYDYFGGTRTVDVHVRRLRAKLGPEHDHMIVTIRNVGYRFSSA